MAESKRYFWLKLRDDFFTSKRIKKLRRVAGGDTYTIIYLKMQLKAIKTGGILEFTGIEDNFAEELALDLDENPDDVQMTVNFLLNCGLLETSDNIDFFLPYAVENTGSETASTQRVRDYRNRQKALQCNADQLQCNTDETQVQRECNESETQVKRIGNVEIEKEINKEINIERDNIGNVDNIGAPTQKTVKKKDVEAVVAAWNALGIQGSISMPPSDSEDGKNLKAILTEFSAETVIEQIRRAGQSSFLSGKRGGWRASFSWICNPENFRKVMTGMYDDRQRESGALAYRQVGHADDEFDPTEIDGIYEKMLPHA